MKKVRFQMKTDLFLVLNYLRIYKQHPPGKDYF